MPEILIYLLRQQYFFSAPNCTFINRRVDEQGDDAYEIPSTGSVWEGLAFVSLSRSFELRLLEAVSFPCPTAMENHD